MQLMHTNGGTKVSMSFHDKDHPIWGIVKPVVITGLVSFLLWLFSANFDQTEIKTIVFTLIGSFGLEAVNVKKPKSK